MLPIPRLWCARPSAADDAWALRWLTPREKALWTAIPGPERRRAAGVARRAATALGDADGAGVPTRVLAAALLRDVGTSESRLGPVARAAAIAAITVSGRKRVARWAATEAGWRRQAGLYARHDAIGAQMLANVGSDPLVVAWATEHHLPESGWTVDHRLQAVLKAAEAG